MAKSSRKTTKKAPKSRSKPKAQPQPLLLEPLAASAHQPEVAELTGTSALSKVLRLCFVAINTLFVILFVVGLVSNIGSLMNANASLSEEAIHDSKAAQRFQKLSSEVNTFEQQQAKVGVQVFDDTKLEQQLSVIQVSIQVGKHRQAVAQMDQLQRDLDAAVLKLSQVEAPTSAAAAAAVNVPILMYHYTPPDFPEQLDDLRHKGYTTITFAELSAALHGTGKLPAKPVILTFDDGFANQMNAFADLKSRNMRATFYIITSGPLSRWCIGAGRRYHDPLQPPQGCGDAYLNWTQVKELDKSGLITIGAHTVDHANLALASPALQQEEIEGSKKALEQQLGHVVTDFAYPYGTFTATSIELVRGAGFVTAVTTNPGTVQTLGSIYTLHRVREERELP